MSKGKKLLVGALSLAAIAAGLGMLRARQRERRELDDTWAVVWEVEEDGRGGGVVRLELVPLAGGEPWVRAQRILGPGATAEEIATQWARSLIASGQV